MPFQRFKLQTKMLSINKLPGIANQIEVKTANGVSAPIKPNPARVNIRINASRIELNNRQNKPKVALNVPGLLEI
jgi:hypothetical protein